MPGLAAVGVKAGAILRATPMVSKVVEAKEVESQPAVHQDDYWVPVTRQPVPIREMPGSESVQLADMSRPGSKRIRQSRPGSEMRCEIVQVQVRVNPMVTQVVPPPRPHHILRVNPMVITAMIGAQVADGVVAKADGRTSAAPRIPGSAPGAVVWTTARTNAGSSLAVDLRARPMV